MTAHAHKSEEHFLSGEINCEPRDADDDTARPVVAGSVVASGSVLSRTIAGDLDPVVPSDARVAPLRTAT